MRVLIMADNEGASGVDDYRQTNPVFPDLYRMGCENQVQDVNAAVAGLLAAGATEIDVIDGHGSGGNMVPDRLHPAARLLATTDPLGQLAATDGTARYDAFLALAQHSMGGTPDGFLSHSNTHLTALRLNGQPAGEISLRVYEAGHHGVPVILVTGDDAAVRETRALFPGISTVAVKTSRGHARADLLPVEEARARITEAAADALRNLTRYPIYSLSAPITVEVILANEEAAQAAAIVPRCRLVGGRTVMYEAAGFPEAEATYYTAMTLALQAHIASDGFRALAQVPGVQEKYQEWMKGLLEHWANGTPPFPAVELP